MRNISCDVAIVGAGTAGLAARSAAVAAGAKTILIESGEGGTTCARVGCMPSKLLLRASAAAREVRSANQFGVFVTRTPRISGRAVFKRIRAERDYFVKAVLDDVAKIPASTKLSGHARFTGPGQLTVADQIRVTAKSIVIAAGAKPVVPEQYSGMEGVLTHETIFELKTLPKSAAIIGAGPLGIEFAVALSRLGVRIAVFDTGGSVGGIEDDDVKKVALKSFAAEFDLHLQVSPKVQHHSDGIRIGWTDPSGRARSSTFEYVLAASGRTPAVDDLDLKITGLKLNKKGIPIFNPDTMQCGDSRIFVAGDVNHDRPVLHEAARQGELAGRNAALYPAIEAKPAGPAFVVAFTDPDFAKVGASLEELKSDAAQGRSIDNGRARVEGRNTGILKVFARRSDRIIVAAEMFGLGVEHLAHLLSWAVKLKLKVDDILNLPFYHPTVEEGLHTAFRDLKKDLD